MPLLIKQVIGVFAAAILIDPSVALRSEPPLPSPPPQVTAAVGNALSSPIFVNLYWDATWDADHPSMRTAALDAFTAAVVSSSYVSGLSEYGVQAPSVTTRLAGVMGFTPDPGCPPKAPASVGFYDPINPSIIGFLNCELKATNPFTGSPTLPRGPASDLQHHPAL
jgi:hypothetical protein